MRERQAETAKSAGGANMLCFVLVFAVLVSLGLLVVSIPVVGVVGLVVFVLVPVGQALLF
jgi:hypothetical protein